ncbi:MAG: hypothetical protein Q7R43_04540 [Candidatus Daviesbacteria bacterium]|nr:hypothetical protein [Candidatus Daviesbacteria bacterium]
MSDGMKSGIGQAVADIHEAVIKPVTDEVGKAIEEGAQGVVGASAYQVKQNQPEAGRPLDERKQEEDLKKKQWAMNVINWNKQLDSAQGKVRQEEKQKQQQVKQEEDEKKKVKQYEVLQQQKKSQQMTALQKESRKTEIKGGVGG